MSECILHVGLDFILVLRESIYRIFQVMGQQHALHIVAVVGNKLAQETERQQVLSLRFFLDNDLCEDRAGYVVPLRIQHDEFHIVFHHLAKMFQGDVAAGGCVIEPPVCIFLDDDRIAVFGIFPHHCHNPQRNFKIIPQRNIAKGIVGQRAMPAFSVEQQLWRGS